MSRQRTLPKSKRFCPSFELLEGRLVPAGFQPTNVEQLFLEQLNDARANPPAYGASIGLDLSAVAPSQPLAFNTLLVQAARLHSQDMNDRAYFDHENPDGFDPFERMQNAGFSYTSAGESLAAGYNSTASALSGLIIDAGVPNLGHRKHLLAMNNSDKQVGIGVVQNGSGPYRHYYTIDTGNNSDTRGILTGVVINDANSNGKYDVGEGLGGATIAVTGGGSTTSFSSGGFSLPLSAGTYTVTASGGGLAAPVTQQVTVGNQNVRLTFISTPPPDPNGTGIGVFNPANATWYLRNSASPGAPHAGQFAYGGAGWIPVTGDWNGDGRDTIGVFNPANATWYLRNTNGAGAPDIAPFAFGGAGWTPVVGDWDGNGTTTIGVVDPNGVWYLRNSNTPGGPSIAPFAYGGNGWKPVVGDWDGNGTTTIGTVNPSGVWYLRNSNNGGAPSYSPFAFGGGDWTPVAGDWDGNGTTTVGSFDPTGRWYVRNSNNAGSPALTAFSYGAGSWKPLAGFWNGPPTTPVSLNVPAGGDGYNEMLASLAQVLAPESPMYGTGPRSTGSGSASWSSAMGTNELDRVFVS